MIRRSAVTLLVAAFCLSLSGWISTSAQDSAPVESELTPKGQVTLESNPEALTSDGDALLVSLMGDKADGSIVRVSWDCTLDTSFSAPNFLRDPMGLEIVGNKIAVADIDRIRVLEKDTGELSSTISFAVYATRRLNDLTEVSDSQVVVSATDIKKLFLVDILTGDIEELLEFELNHPNGVIFDPQTASLYVSRNILNIEGDEGNGSVVKFEVDVAKGRARRVWSTFVGRFLDGIDLKGNSVVISDWAGGAGVMHELDSQTGAVIAREEIGIPGFADVLWDEGRNVVALVSLTGNKVHCYSAD